jgi:hypothetical protein
VPGERPVVEGKRRLSREFNAARRALHGLSTGLDIMVENVRKLRGEPAWITERPAGS